MSLRSILDSTNSPPLVAGSLALSVLALPRALETVRLPFESCRILNITAYALQVVAVSIPGRIDDQVARKMTEEKRNGVDAKKKKDDDDDDDDDAAESFLPSSGRTLVAPAGWAFAVWGPIYLGEAIFVTSQLFMDRSSATAPFVEAVSVPFAFAHLFQTLWCASFRPNYFAKGKGREWSRWVSVAALGSTAWSLSRAHEVVKAFRLAGGWDSIAWCGLPLSLHFGWTTAATLVNVNGAVASSSSFSDDVVAVVGHASVVVAASIGVAVADAGPVVSGVLSWALFAVADGMRQRKAKTIAVRRQETLARIGALVTAGATAWAAVRHSTR